MRLLRITQAGDKVEIALENDGAPRQTESRSLSFSLSAQDSEDIRWYLEDYLVYPLDPAPKIAKRIEGRIKEIGAELFKQVLQGTDIWAGAKPHLGETRIEVQTDLAGAALPWELLREPATDLPLALHVPAFIRGHSQAALRVKPAESGTDKIRILLVICRPGGADDVPFRSVARHLIKGLNDEARQQFDLEVLRPPTFQELSKRLRAAKAEGKPFHVVHFDGHGSSGAVLFENPALEKNAEPIQAAELGKLLRDAGVPVLILNACRSAHAEPPQQPEQAADSHAQIREFGSLAQNIMDTGATGVVAWRYNVYVSTAAQFIADLYGFLASGMPLGEAATLARKQLESASRPIEDWTVPVVYEAAPIHLFPKCETVRITLEGDGKTESGLPQAPDVGFIGRDETILRLDRMFDAQAVVLLHAYAGSGKTSTAAEFARWYHATGFNGPALFTSFERHKKLSEVLDQLGREFERDLEKDEIQWLALDDKQRRSVSLQLLKKTPVLWIWDNVEPVSGFPAGTPSLWRSDEQKELADFLREARRTKARFLLTSRREERDWLHDLPGRVQLSPMTFEDRMQMTAALVEKRGRRLQDVEDWMPLLRFTQGNPLTLTVLVGQALRNGIRSRAQIEDFVGKLRAGEAVFEDEAEEGRTRSLAASLEYGFENAFTEAERKQLALLHLFQGFLDVDALRTMGTPDTEWCLPEVLGLTREAGIALLDRASEVGLLTGLGDGYYTIHPALPWFFRRLFEQYYPNARAAAGRAFAESMDVLGGYYHRRYEEGNSDVIGVLTLEETNLLHARNLARHSGWWGQVMGPMQGLRCLYGHTGRTSDWARLVEELVPDFIDPTTEGPVTGKEDQWSLMTEYRARVAEDARRWKDAEGLLRLAIDWDRQQAAPILGKTPEAWTGLEKNTLRSLLASLHELAEIQRRQVQPECVSGYKEALALAQEIGDINSAVSCAINLGNAFQSIPDIRDQSTAEGWYRRGLELCSSEDRMNRARCVGSLASIEHQKFEDAREAGRPAEEYTGHLRNSAKGYEQALTMLPPDAIHDLAVTHAQLGSVYADARQTALSLHHYREAIRSREATRNRFAAGEIRFNAAVTLAKAGRLTDAREWAQAALRDFEASGNAEKEVVDTLKLLEAIESALRATSPPS